MLTEPIAVAMQVIAVLEQFAIPYAIGGSLASALHTFKASGLIGVT
jgi:hypothetical protein